MEIAVEVSEYVLRSIALKQNYRRYVDIVKVYKATTLEVRVG